MRVLVSLILLFFSSAAWASETRSINREICDLATKKPAREVVDACSLWLADHNLNRTTDKKLGEIMMVRGRAYLQLEDLQAALKDLHVAVAIIGEQNPMPSYYRAIVRTALSEYDAAIEDLQKAISLRKSDARFYKSLGVAFSKRGDYQEALVQLGVAIRLDKRYDNAYFERSNVFVMLGEYAKALEDISRALEIGQTGSYYCQRAWIHRSLGNESKAQADFLRWSKSKHPGYCPPC